MYSIVDEPRGDTYRKLVESSLQFCDSFQFVIRPTLDVSEGCNVVLNKLQPYLKRRTSESEWPGTQLLTGTAEVFQFRLTSASAVILSEVADGLYSWMQPDLPEDLCFLGSVGRPWLVTIAHEKDGYLNLSARDKEMLLKSVPSLNLIKDQTYQ